ncbi:nucleoside/nucleotide kinase family protein [Microlunatus spumicola]|uniref:Nucleoside/nucleotide kinase family protein n=1 Tax=Microlunatus spumicola TaxID=81499 RepID=A0ABP6XIW1_9ACTN
MATPTVERRTTEQLVALARSLVTPGRRAFLGVTGAPGAGKSTLAEAVVAALGDDAVLVSMDGFHLRDDELTRLGRRERKGAIDTFDVAGYLHLLRRLRDRTDAVVYAPVFDRGLEESIGSAFPVPAEVPLVVTEGNYLLAEDGDWAQVRPLLDQCWFLEPGEDVRLERLVARHRRFGRSAEEAWERSTGSDGRNAELVASTRTRATLVVSLDDPGPSPAVG